MVEEKQPVVCGVSQAYLHQAILLAASVDGGLHAHHASRGSPVSAQGQEGRSQGGARGGASAGMHHHSGRHSCSLQHVAAVV